MQHGDDYGGGVDVTAESPLGYVGEELGARLEVECESDDCARGIEGADGVGAQGGRGGGLGGCDEVVRLDLELGGEEAEAG